MRYKFLVVDDTRFMRMMLTNILQENGHEVVGEADNGRTAIELYGQLKPDVTMMDITMSGINGIEAMKEIRRINPRAVVLICSAMSQQDLIGTALDAGADGYVVKPFKPDKVQSVIQESAIPRLLANRTFADNAEEADAAEEAEAAEKVKVVQGAKAEEEPGAEPGLLRAGEAATSTEAATAVATAARLESSPGSGEERKSHLYLIQEQLNEGLMPDAAPETASVELDPPVLAITEEELKLLLQTDPVPQDAAVTEAETHSEADGAVVTAAWEASEDTMAAETADTAGEVTEQQALEVMQAVTEVVPSPEPALERASELAAASETVSAGVPEPLTEPALETVSAEATEPTSESAPESEPAPASASASEPAPTSAPTPTTAFGQPQIEWRAQPALPQLGFAPLAEAAVGEADAAAGQPGLASAQPPVIQREIGQEGRDRLGLSPINILHLCNWREERNGEPAGYAVEVSPGENKLMLEMTGGDNEKTTIVMSLAGFRQLSRWIDKITGESE